jgi:hypothetical protein
MLPLPIEQLQNQTAAVPELPLTTSTTPSREFILADLQEVDTMILPSEIIVLKFHQ